MKLIDADVLDLFLQRVQEELYRDKSITDKLTRESMLLNFQQYVHLQPIVDAVPVVHGVWIKNDKESAMHVEVIYYCSACNNFEAWGETEKTPYSRHKLQYCHGSLSSQSIVIPPL